MSETEKAPSSARPSGRLANEDGNVSAFRRLNLIFRFSYTLPFFMASVCGVVFASMHVDVPYHIIALIPVTVMFMALFVNFSNDYFDSVSGADDLRFQGWDDSKAKGIGDSPFLKKLYWDGNPVNNGLVTIRQAKAIMAFLVGVSILLAIPIFIYSGWTVLIFGGFGLLIAFFYTAPPVNLGARGLGEIAVAASFFLMVFAAYYVASGEVWSYEILVFAILIGLLVGLMRTADSMSGQEAHIKSGERSISVRVGLDRMHIVIKAILVAAYAIVAIMLCFDITYAMLFLTLPLAFKAWKLLNAKSPYWEVFMAPMTFGIALMTEILFILVMGVQMFFTYDLFGTLI